MRTGSNGRVDEPLRPCLTTEGPSSLRFDG
jgi:hypothetical protein